MPCLLLWQAQSASSSPPPVTSQTAVSGDVTMFAQNAVSTTGILSGGRGCGPQSASSLSRRWSVLYIGLMFIHSPEGTYSVSVMPFAEWYFWLHWTTAVGSTTTHSDDFSVQKWQPVMFTRIWPSRSWPGLRSVCAHELIKDLKFSFRPIVRIISCQKDILHIEIQKVKFPWLTVFQHNISFH